jgi:hypothetical protein
MLLSQKGGVLQPDTGDALISRRFMWCGWRPWHEKMASGQTSAHMSDSGLRACPVWPSIHWSIRLAIRWSGQLEGFCVETLIAAFCARRHRTILLPDFGRAELTRSARLQATMIEIMPVQPPSRCRAVSWPLKTSKLTESIFAGERSVLWGWLQHAECAAVAPAAQPDGRNALATVRTLSALVLTQ